MLSNITLLDDTDGNPAGVRRTSAAGIAGLIKYKSQGKLPKNKKIVITVTGNGLKDVQWVLDGADKPTVIPVDVRKAAEVIGLA